MNGFPTKFEILMTRYETSFDHFRKNTFLGNMDIVDNNKYVSLMEEK